MPTLPQPSAKELDVAFLVFVERYATDLLKWDILTFFARQPDFCASETDIAQQIGRAVQSIRPDLGDLVLLGVLEQVPARDGRVLLQLTRQPYLRRMTLKFADRRVARPS